MKKNPNLPKPPLVWYNGRQIISRPECAVCGLVGESRQPEGWEYVEDLNPENGGYVCPKCQKE